MSDSPTNEIKDRLSIEEVISWYIKIEKSGMNFKARCPFHNEKTPSFYISPDRGNYHCYGCDKSGDIFSFVQEMEGVNFVESLKILSEKAGVDISKYKFKQGETEKIDKTLYTVLEKATMFFENGLRESDLAKDYLKSRNVEGRTAKQFRIGYVKDEWQSLYDFLKKDGFQDKEIIESGLVIKNEKGRIYDRFRGRIIFPIFDDSGKVIAYSARILTDDKESLTAGRQEPKYINSPETSLFIKSRILYGFNFAKQTIRKHDFVILVEGQMDVIATHQIGYTNTVASSGTAFTEEQLKIMKRHTNNLLISFDGDSAGIKSSKKVWELALQNEMDVKVIPLEEGKDPSDIINESPEKWKALVKNSKHIIEYFADNIRTRYQDRRKQQKEIQVEIYPYLRKIKSYTDKSYFVDYLSEHFGIDKDVIWSDVNNQETSVETYSQTKNVNSVERKNNINPREILYAVYLSKELKEKNSFLLKIKELISEDLFIEMTKRKEKILLL